MIGSDFDGLGAGIAKHEADGGDVVTIEILIAVDVVKDADIIFFQELFFVAIANAGKGIGIDGFAIRLECRDGIVIVGNVTINSDGITDRIAKNIGNWILKHFRYPPKVLLVKFSIYYLLYHTLRKKSRGEAK